MVLVIVIVTGIITEIIVVMAMAVEVVVLNVNSCTGSARSIQNISSSIKFGCY